MSTLPPLPAPLPTSLVRALGCLAAALLLHGCATPQAPAPEPSPTVQRETGPLVARDNDFAIVIARPGDDASTLAQQYLGDARRSWWITETNGGSVRPGQAIVIPLQARNRIGVYPDGFQTVPALCYHRFGNKASKLTVTPAAFAAQMEYLAQNGYTVIPLSRLGDFLDGKEPLPKRSVVLTIDDGYRATYDIAYPILRKHGFPATVFLYSDFVGASDAMTWPQMKEMVASGLIDIQPHSKSHANLTLRPVDESEPRYRERTRREIDVPINVIQARLGLASVSFAYPYGDVNDIVVDQLARQHVRLGLTVTPGGNGFFAYPYMLRRSMVFGDESLDAFKSKLVTFVPLTSK
jgi:peptidoglycan/xylan/chitin deacetylase (PgdA/CDA1 family)